MQKPRYSVTRGRSGRFNLMLLTAHGRIAGSVAIPLRPGQSRDEMDKAVRDEIAALVGDLVEAVKSDPHEAPREP